MTNPVINSGHRTSKLARRDAPGTGRGFRNARGATRSAKNSQVNGGKVGIRLSWQCGARHQDRDLIRAQQHTERTSLATTPQWPHMPTPPALQRPSATPGQRHPGSDSESRQHNNASRPATAHDGYRAPAIPPTQQRSDSTCEHSPGMVSPGMRPRESLSLHSSRGRRPPRCPVEFRPWPRS